MVFRSIAWSSVAVLLLACGGPSDVTLIRDVQLVHVGAQPPQIGPGEPTTLTATVADPSAGGVEVLVWPCTDLGEGCIEDQGQPVGEWVAVLTPEAGSEDVSLTLTASTLWAQYFDGEKTGEGTATGDTSEDAAAYGFSPALPVWWLACRPGECPWIELARSEPQPGSDDDVALRAFLAAPTAAMGDLPLDGTSLGLRTVGITDADVEDRNVNPELRLEEDPGGDGALEQSTGAEMDLTFGLIDETPDSLQLDGYTTVGTLGPSRTDFYTPVFTWFAGEDAASGRIYIVVRDGEGGSALWRRDGEVF